MPFVVALVTFFCAVNFADEAVLKRSLAEGESTFTVEGVAKDNKWSRVSELRTGVFFMHPGKAGPVTTALNINADGMLFINLSVREDSRKGLISFQIKKNDHLVYSAPVAAGDKTLSYSIPIRPEDAIAVSADKFGPTSQDWGIVKFEIAPEGYNHIRLIASIFLAVVFAFLISKQMYIYPVIAALFMYIWIAADMQTFGPLAPNAIVFYAAAGICLSLTCAMVFQEAISVPYFQTYRFWSVFLICVAFSFLIALLFLTPLAIILYTHSLDVRIDRDAIHAILQSNTSESYQYVRDNISLRGFLLLVLSPLWLFPFFFMQSRCKIVSSERASLIALLFASLTIAATNLEESKLITLITEASASYSKEIRKFERLSERMRGNLFYLDAEKSGSSETYVIVIGESANRGHLQHYGYPRETAPRLSSRIKSGEVIQFNRAFSNHSHTAKVFQLMLTNYDQLEKPKQVVSTIEVLKKAGFETQWLTSHNLHGNFSNTLVSVFANQTDKVVSTNKKIRKTSIAQYHDGALLHLLDEALDRASDERNNVIFVHLMGSHSNYCDRFPSAFKKFKLNPREQEFGTVISKQMDLHKNLNCYDNSIAYTDYILDEIIIKLKKRSGKSALVYMSDHGENVFDGTSHNSSKFDFEMVQIPFLVWLSETFKGVYSEKVRTLRKNQNAIFPNEYFHDTALGLMGVETNYYSSKRDISSSLYSTDESLFTLHGKIDYQMPNNHFYWQNKNIDTLIDKQLASKYFPHRVNSKGKLLSVWAGGLRSFEVDLVFDTKKGEFIVTHDPGRTGFTLEEFLGFVDSNQIDRLWFDIKNLSGRNSNLILAELERLNGIYDLKKKVIIETSWRSSDFSNFRFSNWQTSYYLPTRKVIAALKKDDQEELKAMALNVSKQIMNQKLHAVSFDTRLYEFVSVHLKPLISPETIFHVWFGPKLEDPDFFSKIGNNEIHNDPSIRTFLVKFTSRFDY